MAHWLDLSFGRGDITVLGPLPSGWDFFDGGVPSLYPEFTWARNVYVSGGLFQPYDVSSYANTEKADAYFAVAGYPYDPAWGYSVGQIGNGLETWSPNKATDRVFQEVQITFQQSYYDAIVNRNGQYTWVQMLGGESNWFYYGANTLHLCLNQDAAGAISPGNHTFRVLCYEQTLTGWSSHEIPAGTFTHAQLFNGTPHTIRFEWRGSTITSTLDDYMQGFPNYSSPQFTIASDGELLVSVDGIASLDASGVAFQTHHLWATYNNRAERELEFEYIGKYQYVTMFSLIGKIGYLRAGYAGRWIGIANYHDVLVSSSQFKYGRARVVVDLWTTNGSAVTARLYNVTDGVSVGASAEVSSTTPVETEFNVDLTMGVKAYRLQVLAGDAEVGYFCMGQLMKRAGN